MFVYKRFIYLAIVSNLLIFLLNGVALSQDISFNRIRSLNVPLIGIYLQRYLIIIVLATIALLITFLFIRFVKNNSDWLTKEFIKYKWFISAIIFVFGGIISYLLSFILLGNNISNYQYINDYIDLTSSLGIIIAGAFYKFIDDLEKEIDLEEKTKSKRTEELKSFWHSERTERKRLIILNYLNKIQNSDDIVDFINQNPAFKMAIVYLFNFYEEVKFAFDDNEVNDEELIIAYKEVFLYDYQQFKPWLDNLKSDFSETITRIEKLAQKFEDKITSDITELKSEPKVNG